MSTRTATYLETRGIPDTLAKELGIVELNGWLKYPSCPAAPADYAHRQKNRNSNASPKYFWIGDERPPLYIMPGVKEAIAKAGGVCIGSTGEVDTWSFAAADHRNVVSWFGENSIPSGLLGMLDELNVNRFVYYPDHDLPGMEAAVKLLDMWGNYGIALEIRWYPEYMGTRNDINSIWRETQIKALFDQELDQFVVADLSHVSIGPITQERESGVDLASDPVERDEVERRVRLEIAKHYLIKRGTKNPDEYNCPLPHGPRGKTFYFKTEAGGAIGGCQGKHAGQLTRWRDLADHFDDDMVRRIAAEVGREARERTRQAAPTPPTAPAPTVQNSLIERMKRRAVVNASEAMDTLDDRMHGRRNGKEPSIVFKNPYAPMRALGGFAEIMTGRKGVLGIAPPGAGKTAMTNGINDILASWGIHSITRSKEWTPEEHNMRRVARWGGPGFIAQWKHQMFLQEVEEGIHPDDRLGVEMAPPLLKEWEDVKRRINPWLDKIHYLDDPTQSVDEFCMEALELRDRLAAKGERTGMLTIDYAQREKQRSGRWDDLEFVMLSQAETCEAGNMVWWIWSQPQKDAVEAVLDGKILRANTGQGVFVNLPQLVFTLTPYYDPDTKEITSKTLINVGKNNMGKTPAMMFVATELWHHYWPDRPLGTPHYGALFSFDDMVIPRDPGHSEVAPIDLGL